MISIPMIFVLWKFFGFLKLLLSGKSVCVCVDVCVSAPEAINNLWNDLWHYMKPEKPIKQVLLLNMALAIDITLV